MTLSITTVSIMKLIIRTFNIMTLSITSFNITTLTKMKLSIMTLSITTLSVMTVNTKCHYAECIYVVNKPEFSKFSKKIKVWSLSSSRCKFS